jgi:hypothetical protein
VTRLCAYRFPNGEPCHSPPLRDGDYCLMHSPEHAKEVQDARRIGGLHRKREATLSVAFDFEGLETVDGIRRLLQIAATDALATESSPARSRQLVYIALAALRVLEVRDFEQRLMSMERSVSPSNAQLALPIFDVEQDLLKPDDKENHDSQQTTG